MAFPRKYQKVPLSVREGDDDVQLATLRKRVETAADDVQLLQTDEGEVDSKQSMPSMAVEKRYAVINNACNQIMRHKRLPVGQHHTPLSRHQQPAAAAAQLMTHLTAVGVCVLWCGVMGSVEACSIVCQRLSTQDQRTDATIHT